MIGSIQRRHPGWGARLYAFACSTGSKENRMTKSKPFACSAGFKSEIVAARESKKQS
jgi:hypothetical protein